MTTSTRTGLTALCVRSIDLMATGSPEDFERIYHPQAINREAAAEPPATRKGSGRSCSARSARAAG